MITVISYPLKEINYSIEEPTSTDSGELVKNLFVDLSETNTDTYVEIVFNDVVTTLIIKDEYKYTPIDVIFQNKQGACEVITMFKEMKETVEITSEEFETNDGEYNHQFNKFNVQARTTFTINTGFIDESHVENVKQLLLSKRAWVIMDGLKFPVNVNTKSLEKKTRVNDKLIKYTIGFDFAFNEINNV